MANRDAYILDASVASKWILQLPDEEHTAIARRVRMDFEQGRTHLIAPDYIRAELGHALLKAVRQHRITPTDGEQGLEQLYGIGIETVRHNGILLGAWQLAQRYGCSFYDAGYLALAAMTGSPFIHADGKLRKALGGRFPYELWLEDYSG